MEPFEDLSLDSFLTQPPELGPPGHVTRMGEGSQDGQGSCLGGQQGTAKNQGQGPGLQGQIDYVDIAVVIVFIVVCLLLELHCG